MITLQQSCDPAQFCLHPDANNDRIRFACRDYGAHIDRVASIAKRRGDGQLAICVLFDGNRLTRERRLLHTKSKSPNQPGIRGNVVARL